MKETKLEYGQNYWIWKDFGDYSEIYYSKYDKNLIIDNVDLHFVKRDKKFIGIFRGQNWAVHYITSKQKALHRLIMRSVHGDFTRPLVDHIDNNPSNNRRNNLRLATYTQNNRNRIPIGASKYLGVQYIHENKKWKAVISINKYPVHLGCFDCELDAALAYNKAVQKESTHGRLNDISLGYSNNNLPLDVSKQKPKIKNIENGIVEIDYSKFNKIVKVDEKYLYLLKDKRGVLKGNFTLGYLSTTHNNKKLTYHRLVYELEFGSIKKGLLVDHINGDKLDNRLENLRLLTPSENSRNRKSIGSSKYLGVYYCNTYKAWRCSLKMDGKCKSIGHLYESEEEAALAYDKFCKENNLITRLNF